MAGLTFANQKQRRFAEPKAGLWWVPFVLIVISIALTTLYVRMDGGGVFAVARSGVQMVTKPVEAACSAFLSPLRSFGGSSSDDEVARLEAENEQLRTLVAQLEEYRQQDQRLTSLVKLSDIYGLESISAQVIGITSGWDRTATIDKGSDDGLRVGMGVVSSCGLYGQVESVSDTTAVVRLVNDADSASSAMLQGSNARGIVKGAYDGILTMEYVSADTAVGEGDIVISSGQGGVYPRGIIIGSVSSVEQDSSKLYYLLKVTPIYSIEDCKEVMVLTGNESETQSLLDEATIEEIVGSTASSQASSQTSSTDVAESTQAGIASDAEAGAASDAEAVSDSDEAVSTGGDQR